MFNIGTPELLLILFFALILFGPKKLPEMAQKIGKGLQTFKKKSEEIKQEIIKEFKEEKKEENIKTCETKKLYKPLYPKIPKDM